MTTAENNDATTPRDALDEAAEGGPLAANPSDTSDPAPSREDVLREEDDSVIPHVDNDLDPERDPEDREQAIAADETVGGINMSSNLTN